MRAATRGFPPCFLFAYLQCARATQVLAAWRAQEPINAHAHLLSMLLGSSEQASLQEGPPAPPALVSCLSCGWVVVMGRSWGPVQPLQGGALCGLEGARLKQAMSKDVCLDRDPNPPMDTPPPKGFKWTLGQACDL